MSLTDWWWWIRWMASPNSSATLRTTSRSLIGSARLPIGIVSVTASFVNGHAGSRSGRLTSIAGGAKTAWVAEMYTSKAPWSFRILTAWVIVPPVVIMSSTISTFLSFTSPMMWAACTSLPLCRRLSMMQISPPSKLA